ncbi:MAG: YceI family protein [Candidatus Eisenbacteria bacterium]
MKNLFRLALVLTAIASATAASAAPVTYTIDQGHSEVGFDVKHFFSKVHGNFKEFSGTIVFDEADPKNIRVDASAKAATIFTNNERRDEHLRGSDFFAADSLPTISFKSTSVKPDGPGKYKVTGDFTLRGVTKSVTFDGEFLGAGAVAVSGRSMGTKAGFTATTKINRKDYGVSWNRALDQGGMMLGEDVTITLAIEANQAK